MGFWIGIGIILRLKHEKSELRHLVPGTIKLVDRKTAAIVKTILRRIDLMFISTCVPYHLWLTAYSVGSIPGSHLPNLRGLLSQGVSVRV